MIHSTISLTDDQELYEKYWQIMEAIWPKMIIPATAPNLNWQKMERYFPDFQRLAVSAEKEIIGFISTVPLYWNKDLKDLPDEGWDWLLDKAIEDYENDIAPNCLGGIQIGIAKKYQGQGFSKELIKIGKGILSKNKLNHFILPIRPTLKHKYPLINMRDYMAWKKGDEPFDPWIRRHLNSGAKIIKVCEKSMTIPGTREEWETWSGLEIKESGSYIISGALVPVQMNLETTLSYYYEPNIWIYYQ